MGNELVETIKMGQEGEITKIRPIGSIRDISLIPCILEVFSECFKKHQYSLIFDLSEMEYLTPALITLLFEVTARARRNGGDVEIINLNDPSKHNIANFSALDYLTISAAPDLAEEHPTEDEQVPAAASPKEVSKESWQDDGILPKQQTEEVRIPSRAESIYKACDFVTSRATKAGISSVEVSKIKIAVYEACLNVIEHAYRSDRNQWITVTVESGDHDFNIVILDNGEVFENADTGSYDVIEAASKRKTGGMGLHIIQRSMDRVVYESDPLVGNRLIMSKNIGTLEPEEIHQE